MELFFLRKENEFMKKMTLLLTLSLFSFCQKEKDSITADAGTLLLRNNKLTVTGTAVKGIIKDGTVTVTPLKADGSCDYSKILSSGYTDSTGNYSISFTKTGSVVCITVTPSTTGITKMYDEKTQKDVSVPASSSFKLVTVMPESKIQNNMRKNALVSPFSKLVARRLQYLLGQNPTGDANKLYSQASKEIVIRFGLSSGLSSGGKSIPTESKVSDASYPELDDIILELEKPNSPLTAKFVSVLAGLSQLANKSKKGSELSVDDIDEMINAFAADFEDGIFDGKGPDGKPITIGSGANMITFSSNPLTTVLLPAISAYIQEGGQLTIGNAVSTPLPALTVNDIAAQTQFLDNTVITSVSAVGTPPTGLSYGAASFTLSQLALVNIPAAVSGTVTSCTSSPALPAGLTLTALNCNIAGTPTTVQGAASYTITAANSTGTVSTTISITITNTPPGTLSYTGSPYYFVQNTAIGLKIPTFTGVITNCTSSPALPAGLSLGASTCILTGTPTGTQGATAYTITASNPHGSTNAAINITVKAGKRMFPYNIGGVGGNLGGISGADALCQANRPADVAIAKAFIAAPLRKACLTANCIGGIVENLDWVLTPNTVYINTSSVVMGTTTSSAIFTFSLSAAIPGNWPYWTGLKQDWTTSANLCSNWTSTAGNGNRGGVQSTYLDARFIHDNGPADTGTLCNDTGTNLLCVEQ